MEVLVNIQCWGKKKTWVSINIPQVGRPRAKDASVFLNNGLVFPYHQTRFPEKVWRLKIPIALNKVKSPCPLAFILPSYCLLSPMTARWQTEESNSTFSVNEATFWWQRLEEPFHYAAMSELILIDSRSPTEEIEINVIPRGEWNWRKY